MTTRFHDEGNQNLYHIILRRVWLEGKFVVSVLGNGPVEEKMNSLQPYGYLFR